MIDLEGVVLAKLLSDPLADIEQYAKIKIAFFSEMYKPIYRIIAKLYRSTNSLPTFDMLETIVKDAELENSLAALRSMELPDVDLDLAIEGLVDKYTQTEALIGIDGFLDKITMLDTEEIREGLAMLALDLDSKIHTSEAVVYADQMHVFRTQEENDAVRVPTGISNEFDAKAGGFYEGDLILLGGKRGAGKSIVCANLVAQQYKSGKTSVYYTIEMTKDETMGRLICILAEVKHENYRFGTLEPIESDRLAEARAGMFLNATEHLKRFTDSSEKDLVTFENVLLDEYELHPTNQIIIVDDRELSSTSIDLTLQKFSLQYPDTLSMVAVDYLNQITVEGNMDQYDWKEQIYVSKQLKNLARKYEIPIVSPFQIDDAGQARFSKGILDACDVAMNLSADKHIELSVVKARSFNDSCVFLQPMNWETLVMNPVTIEQEEEPQEESSIADSPVAKARVKSGDDI